jgi:hypothetical protein
MKYIQLLFLVCSVLINLSNLALAQASNFTIATPAATFSSDCASRAAEKKLVGAALSSFTKKCERDAATVNCTSAGSDKKLRGAAKNSFTKKCIKDATNKD